MATDSAPRAHLSASVPFLAVVAPTVRMALRRKEIELSVERPVGSSLDPRAEVVRLTARFETGADGAVPSVEELEKALSALREELAQIPGIATGPDRSLEELIQAYRPRQAELVDLLREEGEITPVEHELLRSYLAQGSPERSESPPAPSPAPPRASAPSSPPPAPRASGARPVEAILEEYRIQSLREAGLVRARRQISFDEYMALKRYFESRSGAPPASDPAVSKA